MLFGDRLTAFTGEHTNYFQSRSPDTQCLIKQLLTFHFHSSCSVSFACLSGPAIVQAEVMGGWKCSRGPQEMNLCNICNGSLGYH